MARIPTPHHSFPHKLAELPDPLECLFGRASFMNMDPSGVDLTLQTGKVTKEPEKRHRAV